MDAIIKFEDVLIGDPVSKRGRDALKRIYKKQPIVTFDEFYKEIYVDPFFEEENIERLVQSDNIENVDDLDGQLDDFAFTRTGAIVRELVRKKSIFENHFFSENTNAVLLIRASAGSGKTIYLNYLKWMRRLKLDASKINTEIINGELNDFNELSFDVELSPSKIQKGNIEFPSSEYNVSRNANSLSAPWCFFTMLLETTFDIIFSILQSKKTIITVLKNKKRIYGANKLIKANKIFELIASSGVIYKNKEKLSTQLMRALLKYCFYDSFDSDASEYIKRILELMTRIIVCKSDMEQPQQVCMYFDNLEHYIQNKTRIYDCDISTIADSIINFVKNEGSYYGKIGLNFEEFFKIVIAIRDTTDKMLSSDVHEYFSMRVDNTIDVTGWYLLDKIYESKIEYGQSAIQEVSECDAIDFFKLILTDCKNTLGNNIMHQVNSMYNHNNRRTTRILSMASGVFEQKSKYSNSQDTLSYKQYKKLWEKCTIPQVKYLCRQATIRLIYNEIERTNYFNRICNNKLGDKSSYARRILVWLSNKNNYTTEEYCSFYDLISGVLCSPILENETVSTEVLRDFAEILIGLDEYHFEQSGFNGANNSKANSNHWCQLIILKFNNDVYEHLNVDNLTKIMQDEFDKHSSDSSSYGIRITEAGYCYVRNMKDYEYFACRYSKNDVPVVLMKNADKIKETIELVFDAAKRNIDSAIAIEFEHLRNFSRGYRCDYHFRNISVSNKIEMQSYPYRVIKQHKRYLTSYKRYLSENYLHNYDGSLSQDERKDICNTIDQYLDKYNDILSGLKHSTYEIDGKIIEGYILSKEDE
ncbi:MAG: hypothetical protein J6Q94_01245 [Clostridia bacterium]|nr:hypothetical protein [Clostridia bacterium]